MYLLIFANELLLSVAVVATVFSPAQAQQLCRPALTEMDSGLRPVNFTDVAMIFTTSPSFLPPVSITD